jgi:hypothetical protein
VVVEPVVVDPVLVPVVVPAPDDDVVLLVEPVVEPELDVVPEATEVVSTGTKEPTARTTCPRVSPPAIRLPNVANVAIAVVPTGFDSGDKDSPADKASLNWANLVLKATAVLTPGSVSKAAVEIGVK